jgi:nitric oxide reductase NorD protein
VAEAEDVIVDAARHATVFVQDLWRRHHPENTGETVDVPQLLHRLDLVISASFGKSYPLRLAQRPAPVPLLRRMFLKEEQPTTREAIPANDSQSIWLPAPASIDDFADLQVMALQQAVRAARRSHESLPGSDLLVSAVFEVLEANAADAELVRNFVGLRERVARFRQDCLQRRPPLDSFPQSRRPLESWIRSVLAVPISLEVTTPEQSIGQAREVAKSLLRGPAFPIARAACVYRDRWIGESRQPADAAPSRPCDVHSDSDESKAVRSARMSRRPEVRKQDERDEQASQGAWMVQTAQPHEHAEDPFGMQRPSDRDEQQAADEFAESLSDLGEARLVSVPGAPKEVLLSDDPPETSKRQAQAKSNLAEAVIRYPEWDWHSRTYREPGAAVHLLSAPHGPREWVDRTLDEHRALLQAVKRQFESLRAQRTRLRQQSDGDDLDLDACVDAFADSRAGSELKPGLYQCTRTARRELAVTLLIDVSGSTDGHISTQRRIIDVEREALLLVCLALDSLREPYSVLAFSGESAARVTVRSVKKFAETFSDEIGLRIAGLEPEHYTRAGAAIRHASALLMREPARHRLLLLLSDGKPNDVDEYDGRYGVEDMRQAIVEARLQGIFPFCLTIDRHTASYLPAVFGEHQYAVLHRPELLPTALLGWLRRLVQT